jgi:hypothetical protein
MRRRHRCSTLPCCLSPDFSLALPTLGVRVADPDDLIGSIDKF